jgi:hypothetical protein
LTAIGNQIWSQESAGIPGRAEHADAFGTSLAAGDFAGTGYDALAVDVPGESVGRVVRAGAVHVIYGFPRGLAARGSQVWTQRSTGIAGTAERNDSFGAALTAANFGHDQDGHRTADLAIGVPGEGIGSTSSAGAVQVMYGSLGQLSAGSSRGFSQDTPGVKGAAEDDDRFGSALAAADFGREGHADLAIGAFQERAGGPSLGAVNVLYGSATGVTGEATSSGQPPSSAVRTTAAQASTPP